MSADNYYLVRLHPLGGYAAVMGFASDTDENDVEIPPVATERDICFPTVNDAVAWAVQQWSEYGVSVHPECTQAPLPP